MKDLQLDDGGVPVEGQINRTVSRRGFLGLAAVAAGGSVADHEVMGQTVRRCLCEQSRVSALGSTGVQRDRPVRAW